MLQGTGSDVGKSLLCAGLCRIAQRRGVAVAPFKPQNMSNNAAVCVDGGEIGRAQALQAHAAGLEPRFDFNPILLKPQSDRSAQLVIHGQAQTSMQASEYFSNTEHRLQAVLQSFERLRDEFELIIVEGAGSPAEINLRQADIANMGFARAAEVPVCLIADIDRGGVIANLVGTQAVLDADDAALICGFIINRFRGDPALFESGYLSIEQRTGWRGFGVLPWLPAAAQLPAEDAVVLQQSSQAGSGELHIVAPMLSRLANFDDADPLRQHPGVKFSWIAPGRPLPRTADVVILFGSKSTRADLEFLRTQGWDHDIVSHWRHGGRVLGLCGGYQMLGQHIHDPDGLDGEPGSSRGLGLLDIETRMQGRKTTRLSAGRCAISNAQVQAYEIHVGQSQGPDCQRPMINGESGPEGARSADGLVEGCYWHGLFSQDEFRESWLGRAGLVARTQLRYQAGLEQALDRLADAMLNSLDIDALLSCAASAKNSKR